MRDKNKKSMIPNTLRKAAVLAARLVLGAVFALSAAAKISAPGLFRADVAAYHMLPPALVSPFATALPWIEALLALYIVIGLFPRPTALAAAALLLLFTGVLIVSLARGDTTHSCGCLPTSGLLGSLPLVTWLAGGATITPFDVARDVVFVGLAALIYWGDQQTLSVDRLLFGPRPHNDDNHMPLDPSWTAGRDADESPAPRQRRNP